MSSLHFTMGRRSNADDDGDRRKRVARKWTEEEVVSLLEAIAKVSTSKLESVNWAEISKQVPGRTGKQCREKYKVRPVCQSCRFKCKAPRGPAQRTELCP